MAHTKAETRPPDPVIARREVPGLRVPFPLPPLRSGTQSLSTPSPSAAVELTFDSSVSIRGPQGSCRGSAVARNYRAYFAPLGAVMQLTGGRRFEEEYFVEREQVRSRCLGRPKLCERSAACGPRARRSPLCTRTVQYILRTNGLYEVCREPHGTPTLVPSKLPRQYISTSA